MATSSSRSRPRRWTKSSARSSKSWMPEANVSTASQGAASPGAEAAPPGTEQQDQFLTRIGHMTRSLHDNLRGLGFDRLLEKAASDMPDARDRLEYVAQMTEQAAQRVLNATEIAGPIQDRISDQAAALAAAWTALSEQPFAEADYRAMAIRTQ